jgi:hypothetical protein
MEEPTSEEIKQEPPPRSNPISKVVSKRKIKLKKGDSFRISQPMRYAVGLITYVMFIYSTGTLILSIITVLQLVNTNYTVLQAADTTSNPVGLGWAEVAIAGIQWTVTLTAFILFHIICQSASESQKEMCFRANLSECAQRQRQSKKFLGKQVKWIKSPPN